MGFGQTKDWYIGHTDAAWDAMEGMTLPQQHARLAEEMAGDAHPKWCEGYAMGLRRRAIKDAANAVADEAVDRLLPTKGGA